MYNFREIISDHGSSCCWEGFLSKCAVPENIHIPPTDRIEFPGGVVVGGGGFCETKKF